MSANSGDGTQYNRAAYQGQAERGGGRRTRIDIPHVEVPTAEDILKMRSQYSEQVKANFSSVYYSEQGMAGHSTVNI